MIRKSHAYVYIVLSCRFVILNSSVIYCIWYFYKEFIIQINGWERKHE